MRGLKRWYPDDFISKIKHNSVINGGFLAGSAGAVAKACELMVQEFYRLEPTSGPWLLDQTVLTFLVYGGYFRCSGLNVVSLTTTNSTIGAVMCYDLFVDRQRDMIVDRFNCDLSLVHWYDRIDEVREFVDEYMK
ncbi:hypothetical protein GEMRC1_009246 [Eukaryota sp. GEM-RC1]